VNWLIKISQDLQLLDECTGYHHGQTDCIIRANIDGNQVGYLNYSIFEDVAYINHVQVDENFRRQGIAKAMYQKLQEENPDIDWGMTTPEGTALKEKIAQVEDLPEDMTGFDLQYWNQRYPPVGGEVSGLTISNEPIANTSSIGASLYDWEELPGIREMPIDDFGDPKRFFYAKNDFERCRELAEEIKQSGEIMPLIVVVEKEGPYILEGGHRILALYLLGIKTFPALVIISGDD